MRTAREDYNNSTSNNQIFGLSAGSALSMDWQVANPMVVTKRVKPRIFRSNLGIVLGWGIHFECDYT